MEIDLAPVKESINKWGSRKDFLVEILQDLQDHYYYLPVEALIEVSKILSIPLNHVYEVATFYKAFSLEPKGKHQINVCLGTACHVQGAVLLLSAFERELRIKTGETDANKYFTLETVRCIGCCGLAPVLTVGKDVYGKVTADEVSNIVNQYREKSGKLTPKAEVAASGKDERIND